MPSPHPKPRALKLLEGDRSDRINDAEPIPADGDVVPPEWLDESALVTWRRLAPLLQAQGVLTAWDAEAFAVGCDAVARHSDAAKLVAERGLLVSGDKDRLVKNPAAQLVRDYSQIVAAFVSRFGLTPADRTKISVGGDSERQGADRLLS